MKLFNDLHMFSWDSLSVNNCNTYFIGGNARVLVDPGHARLFGHVENGFSEIGASLETVRTVICTHGHPDHVEAVRLFRDRSARSALHAAEWEMMRTMTGYSQVFGLELEDIEPDFFFCDGTLVMADVELEVFHTPGHSPGSVCFFWKERKTLFSGDLIFKEGVGRTDLPGGDGEKLKESVRRMSKLDVEWILPGHGGIVSGKKDVAEVFEQMDRFWFNYF